MSPVAKKLTFAILGLAAADPFSLLECSVIQTADTKAAQGVISLAPVKRESPIQSGPVFYDYQIINRYPHDKNAFTQGLIFHNGFLYESTGIRGKSTLRKVDLETGNILQQYALPGWLFGEGLTLWRDKLIQLTWRGNIGFIYDRKTFSLLNSFPNFTEGWGITHNSRYLIMSNGSPVLYFLNPQTFQPVRSVKVHDGNKLVTRLNELEYIKGEIYANIWLTDCIARISPKTGRVLGWINLEGLLSGDERTSEIGVLNGIAYDKNQGRLFVTGKYWPKLFEIKLIAPSAASKREEQEKCRAE